MHEKTSKDPQKPMSLTAQPKQHRLMATGISLAALLVCLLSLPATAAPTNNRPVRGYVIPLIHQDIG